MLLASLGMHMFMEIEVRCQVGTLVHVVVKIIFLFTYMGTEVSIFV